MLSSSVESPRRVTLTLWITARMAVVPTCSYLPDLHGRSRHGHLPDSLQRAALTAAVSKPRQESNADLEVGGSANPGMFA